jgi:hypothetical protein
MKDGLSAKIANDKSCCSESWSPLTALRRNDELIQKATILN